MYSDKDLFEYYNFAAFQISHKELSFAEIEQMLPFEREIFRQILLKHKVDQQ